MPQQAYVWQRAWNAPLAESISAHSKSFDSLVVLAAEVSWKKGAMQIARPRIDFGSLGRSGAQIGAALRIGPFSGPFSKDDSTAQALAEITRNMIREFASNSVPLAEIQIDFDCAAGKLDGYARWLEMFREQIAPVPLCATTLPSWLRQRSFRGVVERVDSFVLQVHSLERPSGPAAPFTLCDPHAARTAVEKAANFGKPFRVALPTYGYHLAFGPGKKFIGLSSEGPALLWPPGAIIREVRSDPAAMAALVNSWTRERPALMRGLIWYRLPVEGDSLNWPWPTLAAVKDGRSPKPAIRAVIQRPQPELYELLFTNRGDASADSLPGLAVQWNGSLFAADALAGFHLETRSTNTAYFTSGSRRELKPGQTRKIGWLRLNRPGDIEVKLF